MQAPGHRQFGTGLGDHASDAGSRRGLRVAELTDRQALGTTLHAEGARVDRVTSMQTQYVLVTPN
jgi:hypothetical protein